MSKGYHGEVAKFAELSWFRIHAKQSKLAEKWKDAHWVGKSERSDEQLLVIRGLTRSARAGRRQARDEKWNLETVKAVLNRIQEWKASTEIDTSVDRQKYITNQALHKHRRAPFCTKCAWDTGAHCRARFQITCTKELAEVETSSHAVDSILSSPGVTGQTVVMEVNTDQIDERDGGASWQRDENQLPTMDVLLDQKATTTATKKRAGIDCKQC